MLAISPRRSSNGDGRDGGIMEGFPTTVEAGDDFDFDDLFVGFDDGDFLPDLELDPAEIFAEFSVGGCEDKEAVAEELSTDGGPEKELPVAETREEKGSSHGEEATSPSTGKDGSAAAPTSSSSSSDADRDRKPSGVQAKGSQGKRKVKVDWTPELHRRFVQAVEQLGVDKAVPSRILELMGIDCLTRHNIASHLQKYRSHRKHLLAREAEAASWSQLRQMYAGGGGSRAAKRDMSLPWLAPTIGFPPPPVSPFRPLHVWGHPTVNRPLVHVWPKHLVHSPPPLWVPHPPLPTPPPPPPPPNPPYWHPHYPRGPRDGWAAPALTQGTPCFPQPMPALRFPAPPVPGVPPNPLYRPIDCGAPPSSKHSVSQLQLEDHPSKESIDAAIGDVLAKPWLPLPLGLKPPSVESVLVELHRQGISKIPPTCS